ncbi:MAG: alpha/beta hydrolase-fold protein [Candidatus Firestonebacteria bacterium]
MRSEILSNSEGRISYRIESGLQENPVVLRIIEPRELPKENKKRELKILFVLPVDQQNVYYYGDGLEQIAETDLHDRHGLILVAPEFCSLPWYCDHPGTKQKDESFLVKEIVPLLESLYPAKKVSKLLLGFSKSGWGALSLLLRNPGVFTAAAAWDAPLMESCPFNYGMKDSFGTQENFDKYRITHLFSKKADSFRNKRLGLFGYSYFEEQMAQAHDILVKLNIPHDWNNENKREHRFGSGWEKEGIEALVKMSGAL